MTMPDKWEFTEAVTQLVTETWCVCVTFTDMMPFSTIPSKQQCNIFTNDSSSEDVKVVGALLYTSMERLWVGEYNSTQSAVWVWKMKQMLIEQQIHCAVMVTDSQWKDFLHKITRSVIPREWASLLTNSQLACLTWIYLSMSESMVMCGLTAWLERPPYAETGQAGHLWDSYRQILQGWWVGIRN